MHKVHNAKICLQESACRVKKTEHPYAARVHQMLKGHTVGFIQMQQADKQQKQNVNKPAEPL